MSTNSTHSPIPLPTPRTLLTSLLGTLFSDPDPGPNPNTDPAPAPQIPVSGPRPTSTSNPNIQSTHQEKARIPPPNANSHPPLTNPLQAVTASQRALLATLHAVFPPPMLLQALDLLDRGLVVRVCLAVDEREEDDDDGGVEGAGNSEREGGSIAKEGAESAVIREGGINLRGSSAAVAVAAAATPRDVARGHQEYSTKVNMPRKSKLEDEKVRSAAAAQKKQARNKKSKPAKSPSIFQVRSSQQPSKSRFRDHLASTTSSSSNSGSGAPAGGNTYTVHLTAWNCSCAAFAFAAFPASSAAAPWSVDGLTTRDAEGEGDGDGVDDSDMDSDMDLDWAGDEDENEDKDADGCEDSNMDIDIHENKHSKTSKTASSQQWQFGGLSSDGRRRRHRRGRDTGTPPICKHLLACLLGDKWKVLGGYVKERVVGRGEMAGLEGD